MLQTDQLNQSFVLSKVDLRNQNVVELPQSSILFKFVI